MAELFWLGINEWSFEIQFDGSVSSCDHVSVTRLCVYAFVLADGSIVLEVLVEI